MMESGPFDWYLEQDGEEEAEDHGGTSMLRW